MPVVRSVAVRPLLLSVFAVIPQPVVALIRVGTATDHAQLDTMSDLILMGQRFGGFQSKNPSGLETDLNGRKCLLCGKPLPERSDREYVQRTDCGNHSVIEHPNYIFKKITSFNRPATEGHPETNAWCELNTQKMCADAIYNRDFLYQPKTVDYPPISKFPYDAWYCYYNGWLAPEYRALQHDFDGMKAKAEEVCEKRESNFHWSQMTMAQFLVQYAHGFMRKSMRPTRHEARYIGAWTCAMGSAGCDITYCAYTFCDKGNGTIGLYDECEGWSPVKGMPISSL